MSFTDKVWFYRYYVIWLNITLCVAMIKALEMLNFHIEQKWYKVTMYINDCPYNPNLTLTFLQLVMLFSLYQE